MAVAEPCALLHPLLYLTPVCCIRKSDDNDKMPLKSKLVRIGNKLKSNPERLHQISADDFLNHAYQPHPTVQDSFNEQTNALQGPNISQVPALVSSSTLSTNPSNVPGPPYSAEDVGRQGGTPFYGVQVLELDGSRQFMPDDRQRSAVWEDRDAQAYEKYYNENLEKVKRASMQEKQQKLKRDEEQKMMALKRDSSRESVRKVRQLIRERYRLDLYVWKKRGVLPANRPMVMESCVKSDKILQQIFFIVNSWEPDAFDQKEWEVAKTIKELLSHQDRHAIWGDLPPWDRDDAA